MYELEIEQLQKIIDDSENIVFFGGAGVSTESGIPDFRSADGIYHQQYRYAPEQVVSHTFFIHHTEAFYDFYKSKMMFLNAKPNAAHLKLAELEEQGKLKAVITQNIDGLHQAAGSKTVFELHGSIHRNYCRKCGKFYEASYVKQADGVPRCECGGLIKPDVVLYEEGLDSGVIQNSIRAISEADTLIIGGTSLVVYPAASFIDYFRGKHLVVINKSATAREVGAELTIAAPIGEIMKGIRQMAEIVSILDDIQNRAKRDADLRKRFLHTREESEPVAAFCEVCRELGYEIYEMELIMAGETFHAEMKRSTNGGGENSPMIEGEDDFYELFLAALEEGQDLKKYFASL